MEVLERTIIQERRIKCSANRGPSTFMMFTGYKMMIYPTRYFLLSIHLTQSI